ncbi:MAG TPA: hypothetical protein VMY39_03430 [Planctomycetota bacterium]|nr:hypothetical protein [Planctomycetota bacterium]HUV38634.1 hypothetical protein [Planctomycetota bacterium]
MREAVKSRLPLSSRPSKTPTLGAARRNLTTLSGDLARTQLARGDRTAARDTLLRAQPYAVGTKADELKRLLRQLAP